MKDHKHLWIRWGTLTACLILIICIGISCNNRNLPVLTVSMYSGTGCEAYMAYDVSEIVNENPWYEKPEITSLPVYKNTLTYDSFYEWASGADFERMQEILLDVAGRLGLDTKTMKIQTNEPSPAEKEIIIEKFESTGSTVPEGYFTPTAVICNVEGIQIEVDQSLTATICFEPAIELPEQYKAPTFATYNEKFEAAQYLQDEYATLIGMTNPKINIYGGSYSYAGQQSYYISFYDKSGEQTKQLLNYNLKRMDFHCDDNGNLFIVRIFNPDLSDTVSEYPIISTVKAEELLLNGHHITNVPYAIPGAEYIRNVELVYRTSDRETYYMPYYRFFVEIPEAAQANGLKNGLNYYGAYYVPAIENQYIQIENSEIWLNIHGGK